MVLIFSQNFTSNGPYVVLNFCEFSDTIVLIFWNFNIFWQFFFIYCKQKQDLQDFVRNAACDASYFGWKRSLDSSKMVLGPYFLKVY